jgi:hypothetical protein
MKKEEIFLRIEQMLDEWDPIGILQNVKPISYQRGIKGEYSQYVKPIIETFIANKSIYDFLVNMQESLWVYPNEEMNEEIKVVSERLVNFLSKCKLEDIQECC